MGLDDVVLNDDNSTAGYWKEYASTDFASSDVSLVRARKAPRTIVMKEDGDLLCKNGNGDDCSLHDLWKGFEHKGQVATILQGQTHKFIAYW